VSVGISGIAGVVQNSIADFRVQLSQRAGRVVPSADGVRSRVRPLGHIPVVQGLGRGLIEPVDTEVAPVRIVLEVKAEPRLDGVHQFVVRDLNGHVEDVGTGNDAAVEFVENPVDRIVVHEYD